MLKRGDGGYDTVFLAAKKKKKLVRFEPGGSDARSLASRERASEGEMERNQKGREPRRRGVAFGARGRGSHTSVARTAVALTSVERPDERFGAWYYGGP